MMKRQDRLLRALLFSVNKNDRKPLATVANSAGLPVKSS
jgi:hypothetical protein